MGGEKDYFSEYTCSPARSMAWAISLNLDCYRVRMCVWGFIGPRMLLNLGSRVYQQGFLSPYLRGI